MAWAGGRPGRFGSQGQGVFDGKVQNVHAANAASFLVTENASGGGRAWR